MTQTALYRHFDADGRLLYAGISASPIKRLAEHQSSAWFGDIRRVDIVMYPDRAAAEVAERAAIRDEYPVHNKHRTFRRKARPGLAVPHANPVDAEKAAVIDEIERYCAETGIRPTTFGRLVGQGGNFFARLLDGKTSPRWETLQKVRDYIADNRK